MLRPSEIKPFLSHPDIVIREFAVNYFAKSFSQDPELMPLILANCRSENGNDDSWQLSRAVDFPQSQETLTEILKRIASQDVNRYRYAKLVRHTEPRLLARNLLAIQQYPVLREYVAQKVTLLSLSTVELWEKLLDFAKVDKDKFTIEFDLPYGEDMVKELATRSDVPILEMRQRLHSNSASDLEEGRGYEEVYMSMLAGELRDEVSIPYLIERMDIEGELISEIAANALVKIGTKVVVDSVLRFYRAEQGAFRKHAASLLGQIKITASEEALLELLPEEEDLENATLLADSLCQLLSTKGIRLVQKQIKEGYADIGISLEEALYANCIINGIDLPELADYKTRMLEERESVQLTQKRMSEGLPFQPKKPYIKEPEVGRNDPCLCGSGKKYKKCCGKQLSQSS